MLRPLGDIEVLDKVGLPRTEKYLAMEWSDGEKKVYFSYTKQGNAIGMHIAAKRKDRFALRRASEEFIQFVFDAYPWCRMIICLINKQSVINLAKNCGFEKVTHFPEKGYTLMMRTRQWAA